MQVEVRHPENQNSITHSPYYGCKILAISKAHVCYEGILDGISINKDRIYLKNVYVNANPTGTSQTKKPELLSSMSWVEKFLSSTEDLDSLNANLDDSLNSVMIEHLTKDLRQYEEVCLNVRDIHELRLIELPSTFQESKSKLHAIDPCLVDIRLSPSDQFENESSHSKKNDNQYSRTLGTRQQRCESIGSDGRSALISSSSNESSLSFGLYSNEKFTAEESNDESIDEQFDNFECFKINPIPSKPATLLAKKVLPKKVNSSQPPPHRPIYSDQREMISSSSTRVSNQHLVKKNSLHTENRQASPIRVTITSKLNPNATPFFTQRQTPSTAPSPSLTFYDQNQFRPRIAPLISPNRSQSLPYGISSVNPPLTPIRSYQHPRFVPPRQMMNKRNLPMDSLSRSNQQSLSTTVPMATYRIQSAGSYPDKRSNPTKRRDLRQQHSLQTTNGFRSPNPSVVSHSSTTSLRSATSLPYQRSNHISAPLTPMMMTPIEPIGSHRSQRASSGASSCSSNLSLDTAHQSMSPLDPGSSGFTSPEGQYDFEKANEEFRRYLELEELVIRRTSLCSNGSYSEDPLLREISPQNNSYKKDLSFFDRISCTATTGTAVGYAEVDERQKNRETFGDDALLISTTFSDDE